MLIVLQPERENTKHQAIHLNLYRRIEELRTAHAITDVDRRECTRLSSLDAQRGHQ